jgi:hypothetical protein
MPNANTLVVRDGAGNVLGCWSTSVNTQDLNVPILRVTDGPLGPTISRQILYRLRDSALKAEVDRIAVTDDHCGAVMSDALSDDGYVRLPSGEWFASVLDVRSAESAIRLLPLEHPARDQLVSACAHQVSSDVAYRLELALWPAKFVDSALPSWLVSIQPRWAKELFSLQDSLLTRPPVLGLSREHIYYRSPHGGPSAPARLLWYASASGKEALRSVVACSHLADVVLDSPRTLYRRFHQLGVYGHQDIAGAAKIIQRDWGAERLDLGEDQRVRGVGIAEIGIELGATNATSARNYRP